MAVLVRPVLYRLLVRKNSLHSLRLIPILAAILLCVPSVVAQRVKRDEPRLRAIGIVEWRWNTKCELVPNLRPIAVLDNNRYWDGALYKATPAPFALQPGIVYEVQDHGNPVAFATINRPGTDSRERWYGTLNWEPIVPNVTKAGPVIVAAPQSSDEPPKLRRPKQGESSQTKISLSAAKPTEDDPDRPRLKRKETSAPQSEEEINKTLEPGDCEKMAAKEGKDPSVLLNKRQIAISDERPYETQSYTYRQSPEERKEVLVKLDRALRDELRAPSPQSKAVREPAVVSFREPDAQVLDTDNDNNAEVIFSGIVIPGGVGGTAAHVTYVGRLDYEGNLKKVFSRTLKLAQTEETPALDFIDAADTNGDGRAELIFRLVKIAPNANASTRGYAIYSLGRDMVERFTKTLTGDPDEAY